MAAQSVLFELQHFRSLYGSAIARNFVSPSILLEPNLQARPQADSSPLPSVDDQVEGKVLTQADITFDSPAAQHAIFHSASSADISKSPLLDTNAQLINDKSHDCPCQGTDSKGLESRRCGNCECEGHEDIHYRESGILDFDSVLDVEETPLEGKETPSPCGERSLVSLPLSPLVTRPTKKVNISSSTSSTHHSGAQDEGLDALLARLTIEEKSSLGWQDPLSSRSTLSSPTSSLPRQSQVKPSLTDAQRSLLADLEEAANAFVTSPIDLKQNEGIVSPSHPPSIPPLSSANSCYPPPPGSHPLCAAWLRWHVSSLLRLTSATHFPGFSLKELGENDYTTQVTDVAKAVETLYKACDSLTHTLFDADSIL